MDFEEGFLKWQEVGVNYEGGQLNPSGRTAIHFVHRLGAIVALIALGLIGLRYLKHTSDRVRGGLYFNVDSIISTIGDRYSNGMVWHSIILGYRS